MSDAELIYNACLRAEKTLEQMLGENALAAAPLVAIKALRQEIGNGLAGRTKLIPDSDAVCVTCRHKGAHAVGCPNPTPWPMVEVPA